MHNTSSQQPMLQQIGDPLAVFLIRLPPWHCFDVLRIHQQHLKLSFQKVPHRLPIHSRGLHRYMGYSTGAQPIAQLQQLPRECSERPGLTPPPGGPQPTRRHPLLVNIQTATDFMYNLHRQTPSAAERRTSANYRNSLACSPPYDRGNSSLCPSTSRSYSYSGSNRARMSRPSSTWRLLQHTSIPSLFSWFVVVRRTMIYSYRSETIGSTRDARRAGTYAANSATAPNIAGTAKNTIGSRALTPNNRVSSRRDKPQAAAMPMTTPASVRIAPCATTILLAWLAFAPKASRIPISCVRCPTVYAISP